MHKVPAASPTARGHRSQSTIVTKGDTKFASVVIVLRKIFAGLSDIATPEQFGDADVLARCFLVYYPRYVKSRAFLSLVVGEMKVGRDQTQATRFLSLWIATRFSSDFRDKHLMEKLCSSLLRTGKRCPTIADEVNKAKLALIRAASVHRRSRNQVNSREHLAAVHDAGEALRLLGSAPLPVAVPRHKLPNNVKLMFTTSPKLVAAHLKAVEFELFSAIQVAEFYNEGWKNPHSSPNLCSYTQRLDRMPFWVASIILSQPSLELQSKVAARILEIANFCYDDRNYATCIALFQGFSIHAVSRLKALWNVPKGSRVLAHRIDEASSPKGNYATFYSLVAKCTETGSSCIPYLAPYQKTLTLIEQGNPDLTPEGIINETKICLIGKVLCEVSHFQNLKAVDYDKFRPVEIPELTKFITLMPAKSEDELTNMSQAFKPVSAISAAALADDSWNTATAATGDSNSSHNSKNHVGDESSSGADLVDL